ncbi:DUF4440 domain-containing protein [Ktedonosporobacter rubrisoli]|uniref:DUF4440 domain-containing protein n=1 Tax=Ktedonosporobacter rubrisoli TaxID=2509675 RepID=A0A4P6JHR3_KTERU|nr:nuclear transport factor 2 family protein [Ktedonosporobacter rubrisoli]QBD74564.1 DUF4440 domain-containing protein [Ktedonosporobacter rubrisoli]
MGANSQDKLQIEAIVEHYLHGFASADATELQAIWDQNHDKIVYIAQELAQPVQGWQAVERYYQQVTQMIGPVKKMEARNVIIDVFGDTASVFLLAHFEGEYEGQQFITDARVTFQLQRKSGTWKVTHYHESRPPSQ